MNENIKEVATTLLTSAETVSMCEVQHGGISLTLVYVPPKLAPDHRLYLAHTHNDHAPNHEETQATLTALLAAIIAAGYLVDEPGVEVATDQARAGHRLAHTVSYCTVYTWQMHRPVQPILIEDER